MEPAGIFVVMCGGRGLIDLARGDSERGCPESIAEAMAEELTHTVEYREVETDGAVRAASMIADLL